uniref:Band 7 domain-containing protein n=1 Tax=Plectus sambesii TaxID=2011161 RepID=A0A914VGK8_9BILA
MGNIHTVGPNEALVVSGGCCGAANKKITIGGWGWAWWCVTDVQRLNLEVMTLNPRCEHVETAQGVPLTVTGVAQVKVMTEKGLLETACEQFMGKPVQHIAEVILQTLDGHLRAILGTMTVEAVYQDRESFAQLVREVAAPDIGRMGMEILSFTIKDVVDSVEYLNSLGKTQTANVKRDAEVGVAEANRDAGIREAECQKAALDVRYVVDSKVANAHRELQLQQASFDQEVNTKRAQAELAYKLQAAKEQQAIRQEEIQIDVVERRKQIAIEEKEIERKETELFGTVRLPAEAEAFKVQTIAEGKRTKVIEEARAHAEATKMKGSAQAAVIQAVGRAEAEKMRMKAGAYKQYGDAAITALVLEALPKIAAEVSAPLSKTREIVIVGGNDRATSEMARLAGSLPPTVQSLTGIDITKIIQKAVGAN